MQTDVESKFNKIIRADWSIHKLAADGTLTPRGSFLGRICSWCRNSKHSNNDEKAVKFVCILLENYISPNQEHSAEETVRRRNIASSVASKLEEYVKLLGNASYDTVSRVSWIAIDIAEQRFQTTAAATAEAVIALEEERQRAVAFWHTLFQPARGAEE